MENLNAEQVKKALECCHSCNEADCKNCGYRQKAEGVEDLYISCTNVLIADALALINSQEQRIKELAEENERLRVVADMSDTTLTDALRIVNEFCDNRVKRSKADTVRKMAESIKLEFYREFDEIIPSIMADRIDQIAKEMLEGENEKTHSN